MKSYQKRGYELKKTKVLIGDITRDIEGFLPWKYNYISVVSLVASCNCWSFLFISERTPSKILRDFLDRFAQSLNSGVDPREFIENEQGAVLEDYKTMYETANDNITILNEVYVSLLIAIIFIMSLGIVLPMIIGAEDMNTFIYLSSFLLIMSEVSWKCCLRSECPIMTYSQRSATIAGEISPV